MTKRKTIFIIFTSFLIMVTTVICILQTMTILKQSVGLENAISLLGQSKILLIVLLVNEIITLLLLFLTFEETIPE